MLLDNCATSNSNFSRRLEVSVTSEFESRGEGQEGVLTSGFDPAAKLAARVVLDEVEVIKARGLPD